MKKLVVMDAQGGGLGRMAVELLKKRSPQTRVTAVGTNALATAAMLKAGADQGATGENAVCRCAEKADVIIAPIGMVLCDAMLGEVTGRMACAVGASEARKVLIPSSRCSVTVAGCAPMTPSDAVAAAVEEALRLLNEA